MRGRRFNFISGWRQRSDRADRDTPGGYWECSADHSVEFQRRGYRLRHFFPHRVFWLPKCGPDGFMLADWMCRIDDPEAMREILLYATPEVAAEFPRELFFDDELVWHQQQFGLPGQVACATVVLDGRTVFSITHVSDLVQRISRHREHKTRVEKRFKGWNHMLLNSVLHFATAHGAKRVRVASAALAARHTDHSRRVDPTIFERIYDHTINSLFEPRRRGDWWELDLGEVRERIVVGERKRHPRSEAKTICICHDIERGWGHQHDPLFAKRAEDASGEALATMRQIEAELGVRCTYNVVGKLMPDVRREIEKDGHCVAFHSFDHRVDRDRQLERCRQVDYRVKGYRVPESRLTPELSARNLLRHNFEWLASSTTSLQREIPILQHGVVRLPIAFDDFSLHTGERSWDQWQAIALEEVHGRDFVAIGLHDCYAEHWLPGYRDFLLRVRELGELRTMDEVAAEVTLRSAG